MSAVILLDREPIGIIGRVHPNVEKDDVYVVELSLQKLMKKIKPIKFKEAPKYPSIEKDMAFIVNKDISAGEIIDLIRKKAGRLLKTIDVFDVYVGENVANDNKSLAFHLIYQDDSRTLTDEEVMASFNNVIGAVEQQFNAVLRDK